MMTDDGNKQGSTWPMPKFRFEVDFGTELKGVAFQEVSGLNMETQIIDYRTGDNQHFSTIKMPGIVKFGQVTLKRGIFANDKNFWNWLDEIKMNKINRKSMLIKLLDESGNVTMQWLLSNAWPTKITGTDLKSDGNKVAIDTIEIAHEQITIANGQ